MQMEIRKRWKIKNTFRLTKVKDLSNFKLIESSLECRKVSWWECNWILPPQLAIVNKKLNLQSLI